MPATATRTQTVQICDVKLWKRFRFVESNDGDGNPTEYVKVMPTHYRKADAEGAVCLPVVRLPRGIRTQVTLS